MVTKILERAGKKVAMASTINFRINGEEETNTTKYTTLSAFATQNFIKRAVEAGAEYLVLETSSHSLDQHRVWGVRYITAVITNVTREHLDYHKTMEQYRNAKKKLFLIAAKNKGTAIVNLDMEKPEEYLYNRAAVKFGYTTQSNHEIAHVKTVKADISQSDMTGSVFTVDNDEYRLQLPGIFNIENALAAICVGKSENIEARIMIEALADIKNVPGRMEYVANEKGIDIIVDYAVTPDSLEKLYALIRKAKKESAKIIAVFGSCGERDRGKRPMMGKIVSQNADMVIVTNEDPYHEDPQQIINEVATGVVGKVEDYNFWKIMDRRDAIHKALSIASSGDIVVVTGKGAEETMAIGDSRIPWNDKRVIQEELQKI